MRIAVITDSFPKLSETFVLNQITGLLELGHDVHVFPTWHAEETKVHPDVAKYGLLARTHPIPPTPASKVKRLLAAAGIFLRGFAVSPVRTFRLLRLTLTDPSIFSLRILHFLSRFPDGFDVLHCHYGYNGLLAVTLRKLGVGGFIGTVFHGHDMSQFVKARGPHVYDELFSKGDVFLPISNRWRVRLLELGCPADRTIVHHMGVDLDRFTFPAREIHAGETVRLLNIARLAPTKGHEYLLKAVVRLLAAGRRVSLAIAGDGPLAAELKHLTATLGLAKVVEFVGPVSQDQVHLLMMKNHILVQPSVTASDGDQEGIPVVLMEAMASGMPVVATDHSGIPELVEDRINGLLVPERDADTLADNIAQLIDNPALWVLYGRTARAKVSQLYNIHTLNIALVDIYVSCTGRRKA